LIQEAAKAAGYSDQGSRYLTKHPDIKPKSTARKVVSLLLHTHIPIAGGVIGATLADLVEQH